MFEKSFLSRKSLIFSSIRCFRRQIPKQGKPSILPPSKKVLYTVINVPWDKKEDVEELLWRRHLYNNTMITMRQIFRDEVDMKEKTAIGLEAIRIHEKEELDRCIAMNEERNKKLRAERKIREEEEFKITKQKILEMIEDTIDEEEKNVSVRKEDVLEMIEASYNFVTKENLDARLTEALENPTTFDFAIDLQGKTTKNLPRFI